MAREANSDESKLFAAKIAVELSSFIVAKLLADDNKDWTAVFKSLLIELAEVAVIEDLTTTPEALKILATAGRVGMAVNL